MVFSNTESSRPRVKGVTYTKAPLELDDLYARIVSDKETLPLVQGVLSKYGYDFNEKTSPTQYAHKLAAIVMNAGEPALKDLATIHPDKKLILHFLAPASEPQTIIKEVIREVPVAAAPKKEEAFEHDCGCGGHNSAEGGYYKKQRGNYRYAEGETTPEAESNKYLKPVLLLSFTALACVVIWKM